MISPTKCRIPLSNHSSCDGCYRMGRKYWISFIIGKILITDHFSTGRITSLSCFQSSDLRISFCISGNEASIIHLCFCVIIAEIYSSDKAKIIYLCLSIITRKRSSCNISHQRMITSRIRRTPVGGIGIGNIFSSTRSKHGVSFSIGREISFCINS